MIALAIVLLLCGAAIAWGGPVDPEYASDWAVFFLGIAMVLIALMVLNTSLQAEVLP